MKIDLNTILIIVAAVVIILILKGGSTKDIEATVKAKDETIRIIQAQTEAERERADIAIRNWRTADSLLSLKVKTNTTIIYEKIPERINSPAFTKDSLRRAVREF